MCTVANSIRTNLPHAWTRPCKVRVLRYIGTVAVTHLWAHTLNVQTSKVPVIYYTGMLSSLNVHTSEVPVIDYTGILSSLYTAQINDISVLRTSRVYIYSVCLLYIYRECLSILLALLLYLYVSSRPVS